MALCGRHPRERAGWHCATCRADLCPDCVAKQPGGAKGRMIPVCCTCGRGVTQLTRHRRAAQPFGQVLGRAFGFPLGSTGIITMAFVGLVRAVSSYGGGAMVGGAGFAVRQGLYWALIFFTIRSIANGQRRMGVFDFSDIHSDLVAPAVKGIFSTAILWIPAAIYIYMAADGGFAAMLTYPAYRDPAVWVLALIGGLYAPMALLAAATDLGYGYILNPIFIFHTIFRIGRNYLTALLAIAAVLLVGGGLAALVGVGAGLLPIPFVGRWLTATVGLYPPFVAAGMLGALLFVHGEVLDWGRAEEYLVPILPVEPRGRPRPRWDEHPQQPLGPSAIDLPAATPAAAPALASVAPSGDRDSLLNLSGSPVLPAPVPRVDVSPAVDLIAPAIPDKPPSLLKYGIEIPSGILAADGLLAPDPAEPIDLPPASAVGLISPSAVSLIAVEAAAATSPSAISLAAAVAPPAPPPPAGASNPVTAFVEPCPGPLHIASAPTVHGFSTALLPQSEAPATRVGHEAVPWPPEPDKPRRE